MIKAYKMYTNGQTERQYVDLLIFFIYITVLTESCRYSFGKRTEIVKQDIDQYNQKEMNICHETALTYTRMQRVSTVRHSVVTEVNESHTP